MLFKYAALAALGSLTGALGAEVEAKHNACFDSNGKPNEFEWQVSYIEEEDTWTWWNGAALQDLDAKTMSGACKEAADNVEDLLKEAQRDDIGQLLTQLESMLKNQIQAKEASMLRSGQKALTCADADIHGDTCNGPENETTVAHPDGDGQCLCTCSNGALRCDATSGALGAIRRFKNLKAMVMTMQPPHVTVFGRYCYYGCWCLPNGQHNLAAGYGQPVDPIDEVCKEFALCYKCLDMDFAGTCNPEKRSYRWGRVKDNAGVTYDLACKDNPDKGPNHRCKRYTCECDRVLAMGLGQTHGFWNESHHARWGGFDREASCETDCVGCIPQDDCCGAYGSASTDSPNPLTRRPYASTNPNSGCCQDVFYYNTIAQECCVDGTSVSVTDQGTCPGTVVDPDEIDDFDDTFPGYTRK
jgi:hypothetical protein